MSKIYFVVILLLLIWNCNSENKTNYKDYKIFEKYKIVDSLLTIYELENAKKEWKKIDTLVKNQKWDSLDKAHQLSYYRLLLNDNLYDTTLKILNIEIPKFDSFLFRDIYYEMRRLQTVCQTQLGLHKDAINNNLKILPYYEETKNYKRVCSINANTGWSYFHLNQWNNALEFCHKSIKIANENNFNHLFSDYNQRIATIYAGKLQFDTSNIKYDKDSALKYFGISKQYIDTTNPNWDLSNFYINLSGFYNLIKDYKNSILFGEKGLKVNVELDDIQGQAMSLENLASSYRNLKNYTKANEYYLRAEKLAIKLNNFTLLSSIYRNLGLLNAETQNYKNSTKYYQNYITYYYKEFNKENLKNTQELAKKYETEKIEKELQISQNNELKTKNKLLYTYSIIGFACFILLSIILFFYISLKNRKKIEKVNLEHQKKQTEYEERLRISRNLHDNLGAYASSIKKNIDLIENNIDKTSQNNLENLKNNADQILFNLKNLIVELNQKKLAFLDFNDSLKTELIRLMKSYSDIELDMTENINFNLLIDPEKQLHIKSMIFEVVQNSIKHSGCKNIHLFMKETNENIEYEISDDGVYSENIFNSKGNGITNITKRLLEINGECMFYKNSNNGTTAQIIIQKWS